MDDHRVFLGDVTADALFREAERLGAYRLIEAMRVIERTRFGTIKVTHELAWELSRALDHLSNTERGAPTGPTDKPRQFVAAREALLERLAVAPLTYRLRSWQLGERELTFWSYTGEYRDGDRLVAADGSAWRVTEVARQATPAEDGVLIVEAWRD